MEEKIKNERIEKFTRAAQTLLELMQQIDGCTNEKLREFYIDLADGLEAEIMDAFEVYKENLMQEGLTVGEYVVKLKPFMDVLRAYQELKEGKSGNNSLIELPEDMREEFETILSNVQDSGLAIINDSPVVKKMLRPEAEKNKAEPVILSHRENAVFTLMEGYIKPEEKAILEAIAKHKLDGQIDQKGRIFCTVGQIYRALRGGVKKSPTQAQKIEMMEQLKEMAKDERKMQFEMSEYLLHWGDFESNGGRLGLIHYDEFFGRIKGQKETLIVFYETPFLNMIAENLKMQAIVNQEIKAIKYTAKDGTIKNYPLSTKRIALREVIFTFVFSYIRARTKTATSPATPHSNQLPYKKIFELCNISDRKDISRQKEAIWTIFEHLKSKGIIAEWKEYSNLTSNGKPDGIQIKVSKEVLQRGE